MTCAMIKLSCDGSAKAVAEALMWRSSGSA